MDAKDRNATNVLLVEDNPGDVRLMREALSAARAPGSLSVCRDGVEALDFLYRRGQFPTAPRPDLVLLDLNLPRKNGREVLSAIKTDAALSLIPVVVYSSSAAHTDIDDSYQRQANCYVIKPMELKDLMREVRAIWEFWLTTASLPERRTA